MALEQKPGQVAEPEIEPVEQQEEPVEQAETPAVESPEAPANEPEEVVIGFGDAPEQTAEEQEAARAPEWVRELRKTNREQAKRIRELEQAKAAPVAAPVLGAKPTLEACDFDADKFEAELDAWKEKKAAVDAEQRRKEEAAKAEQEQWQNKLKGYAERKTALKVPDFEEAEAAALENLDVNQQGVILHALDDAAAFVYAIGKTPEKLKTLAAIKDPIKFAAAAAKLETQMKVSTKSKTPPPPESVVRGSAPLRTDAKLEQLEKEFERTGDRTPIIRYKAQLRAQGK